jgi:hypothetical protein
MAKRFLTSIELANLSSDPETGSEGELYFNTSDNAIKVYTDGEWIFLNTSASAGIIDGGGPSDF